MIGRRLIRWLVGACVLLVVYLVAFLLLRASHEASVLPMKIITLLDQDRMLDHAASVVFRPAFLADHRITGRATIIKNGWTVRSLTP